MVTFAILNVVTSSVNIACSVACYRAAKNIDSDDMNKVLIGNRVDNQA